MPGLLVLDGGACPVGLESTVLDLTQDAPVILRPGTVTADDLAKVLGRAVDSKHATAQGASPGTAVSHYAPVTPARLVPRGALADELARERGRCAVLAASTASIESLSAQARARHTILCMPQGWQAYAAALYDRLRLADAERCSRILIEDPATEPVDRWAGVRDRLRRATARRA
ncbi:MAG: hypothetical protein JNK53_03660 [Phycisphaerae bacterium]|nr:hypothetical protein [Phycisphaerae bacterium]